MRKNNRFLAEATASVVKILSKNNLGERDADIVCRVVAGERNEDIGKDYNISYERVRQIANKALSHLQERAKSYERLVGKCKRIEDEKRILEIKCNTLQGLVLRNADVLHIHKADTPMPPILTERITDTFLSVRAKNCLFAAHISYVYEIVRYNKLDLLKFRNFGKKSLTEIEEFLRENGLCFGMDLSVYCMPKE